MLVQDVDGAMLTTDGYYISISRKDGGRVSDESQLLYKVKNMLNDSGLVGKQQWIKKLMHKDGHMVPDTQHYLRVRNTATVKEGEPYAIYQDDYAIYNAAELYNRGESVSLKIERSD